ncbi:MAG: HAD family phosphatase [Clostridia bacterium]|nr:HAD family phosphatase [Clostridia bacterium]
MIKNYIFDFGQVIVKFDPFYMTSVYIKDETDCRIAKEVIFDRLYWDKLDEGTISDGEVIKEICNRLPERLHKGAVEAYENWYRNIPFIDGMRELIYNIKATGKKLFLLSNISKGFAENYSSVPELEELFKLFDGLVFSGPIGITKPNGEIFEYLLNKYGLKAEESVFIDDSIKNIKGAEAVGIKGFLFEGDASAIKEII